MVFPQTESTLGLKHLYAQVDDFVDYNTKGKQFYNGWTGDDAIFLFYIGINDLGNSFYLSGDRLACVVETFGLSCLSWHFYSFNDVLIDNYFKVSIV